MSKTEVSTVKLEPKDASYIAGLFDGEGCICIGWNTKSYFSIKGQQRVVSHSPQFQLAISNNSDLLLEIVKNLIGFGNFYKSKNSNGYCYRVQKREEILAVINALLPFVKLKRTQLYTAREAIEYHIQRGHSPWTAEQKKRFYDNYMAKLEKGEGRPTAYTLEDRLNGTQKFLKKKPKTNKPSKSKKKGKE